MAAEELQFIHRYLPAPEAGAASTLLLLHGTGGDENDLLDLGRMLAPSANLLSPRGQVLENGMPRFFRRLAEGVFDVADLQARAQYLARFVQDATAVYGLDPQRLLAVGFSNGANIASGLLLLRPEILQAAILFAPMVPFLPETLPDLAARPIFLGAGQADPIVPRAQTEQLAALFEQAGADVRTFWHPGGHTITHAEVRAAREWLLEKGLL